MALEFSQDSTHELLTIAEQVEASLLGEGAVPRTCSVARHFDGDVVEPSSRYRDGTTNVFELVSPEELGGCYWIARGAWDLDLMDSAMGGRRPRQRHVRGLQRC